MLVLSRKTDESFLIYVPGRTNPIRVTNVRVEKAKTRLGVEADQDITIVREELTIGRPGINP